MKFKFNEEIPNDFKIERLNEKFIHAFKNISINDTEPMNETDYQIFFIIIGSYFTYNYAYLLSLIYSKTRTTSLHDEELEIQKMNIRNKILRNYGGNDDKEAKKSLEKIGMILNVVYEQHLEDIYMQKTAINPDVELDLISIPISKFKKNGDKYE